MRFLTATALYLICLAIPIGLGAMLSIWIEHRETKQSKEIEEIDWNSIDLT